MSKKEDCIHFNICDEEANLILAKVNCTNCADYEPKRVKCSNIIGCVKERYVLDKEETFPFIKNEYCPRCGTRIEVK